MLKIRKLRLLFGKTWRRNQKKNRSGPWEFGDHDSCSSHCLKRKGSVKSILEDEGNSEPVFWLNLVNKGHKDSWGQVTEIKLKLA